MPPISLPLLLIAVLGCTASARAADLPKWRSAFLEFPDRFMLGTDTCVPERWYFVAEHARWSGEWLKDLPPEVAERIAWRNGQALIAEATQSRPKRVD